MLQKYREKIAVLFARQGMFGMFCFVRGNHTGLNRLGRCLACGKTNGNEPKLPPLRVTEFHPIQEIAADDQIGKRQAFVRNASIRIQERERGERYGL